ncbi:hypothetical protein ABTX61_09095 [Amycolatopsis japonica]|uniref:hypothetical protein n=1 Tax=Amycolatopsis japonica TaxID=208439 RepID=UPI003329F50B
MLVTLPMALSGLPDDDEPRSGPNAGYAQDVPPGGGFVPGLAAAQTDNSGGSSSGPPGGELPAQAAGGAQRDQGAQHDQAGVTTDGTVPGPGANPGGAPGQVQQHQPQQQTQPQGERQGPPVPAPRAKSVVYEGMAGRGCGGGTQFTGVGAYSDGKAGWVNHGNGGCGTSFVSIPMSGDANRDDPSAYGVWTFNTGPVTAGSCAISVFIPSGDVTVVGGSPSVYRVFDRFAVDKATPVGTFQIDQVANRGKWVSVGTFRANDGKLAVQLLNRGRDWAGSTKTYAHHAAAMIKANCKA